MRIEPVEWKFYQPLSVADFPCISCENEIAAHKVKITYYPNLLPKSIEIMVCSSCLEKGEIHLRQSIERRYTHGEKSSRSTDTGRA